MATQRQFSLEPIKMKLLNQTTEINIDEMGNTIEVDHELDQIIKAHAQVQKRKSIQDVIDNQENRVKSQNDASQGNGEHALSQGDSPTCEDRYDALNESTTVLPSTMKLADLIVQKNPNVR